MATTRLMPLHIGKGRTVGTAIKAAPFSYEIVFPTTVAEITAAGAYEVGQAKVENVVSATDNTVISYTATTTNFKLSTDESKTMAATYHTEQAATNAFPTDAVKVYENKADVANLPTMWVKITEDDWNAAAAGTYTATVTFNFSAEEKAAAVTVASILPDNFGSWSNGGMGTMGKSDTELYVDGPETAFMSLTNKLTPTGDGNYTGTSNFEDTWTFIMDGNKCNKIIISDNRSMVNGEYTAR